MIFIIYSFFAFLFILSCLCIFINPSRDLHRKKRRHFIIRSTHFCFGLSVTKTKSTADCAVCCAGMQIPEVFSCIIPPRCRQYFRYLTFARFIMQRNRVEICGVNTANLKVLTDDEKHALLLRARAGDETARAELISGNLRLVLSIVQRFAGRRESMDDLFQVGCIGLVKAVDNFNLDLEVKFSTYAVPMIIGEIRRYLRDNNAIRISRSTRDLAYRALQVREELIAVNEREPTAEEIAARLGEKKEAVLGAMEAIVEPLSLYEPVYNDGGDALYLMDQLSDTTDGDAVWLENIVLRDAMKHLTPREQNIIRLRFWRNKTQMEIAGEIGISQAQVSRLEKAALEKMRKQM